jgi:hypothetical protein
VYSDSNPKIDIYLKGVYQYSTNWSKTCKEAKQKFLDRNPNAMEKDVKCKIDKR